MDSRISISNLLFAISFDQFKAMVTEFKAQVEASFGTSCCLDIRAMSSVKMTSTFLHDDGVMEYMDECNRRATFFEGSDVQTMPPEAFKQAVYIEVGVRPVDASAAPNYAFGHIEFKGTRRRQATYYMQPGDDKVFTALRKAHGFQIVGDGYTHNSDC